MGDTYTHGHHEAVVAQHAMRTAENCAQHLLGHLGSHDRILDIGCGPGSITLGLAEAVPDGEVLGLDLVPEMLASAGTRAQTAGLTNVEFDVGDIYDLDIDDGHFDVVHAHQVLQHLARPVDALTEMCRVTRTGGIIAVRDVDFGTFVLAPDNPVLDRWLGLYQAVARHNGAEPQAGRYLQTWCNQAGIDDVTITSTTWTFADTESVLNWGNSWAERTLHSSLGEQAVEYGLADQSDLEEMAAAWKAWAVAPDAVFYMVHVAALATVA